MTNFHVFFTIDFHVFSWGITRFSQYFHNIFTIFSHMTREQTCAKHDVFEIFTFFSRFIHDFFTFYSRFFHVLFTLQDQVFSHRSESAFTLRHGMVRDSKFCVTARAVAPQSPPTAHLPTRTYPTHPYPSPIFAAFSRPSITSPRKLQGAQCPTGPPSSPHRPITPHRWSTLSTLVHNEDEQDAARAFQAKATK